ncbi:hypothetical protein EB796_001993 [Bugula neritina]|uniref:Uncharacterized protein n=1 Tax=Bugula neritina TaxID=10212 RepID=A0A7J7KNE7_BUGNE|nr:hypothetical protein EB796_001993 [Bugula neritina]
MWRGFLPTGQCAKASFVMNASTFPSFDLILPHMRDHRKQNAFSLDFTICWPTHEEDDDDAQIASSTPAIQCLHKKRTEARQA